MYEGVNKDNDNKYYCHGSYTRVQGESSSICIGQEEEVLKFCQHRFESTLVHTYYNRGSKTNGCRISVLYAYNVGSSHNVERQMFNDEKRTARYRLIMQ